MNRSAIVRAPRVRVIGAVAAAVLATLLAAPAADAAASSRNYLTVQGRVTDHRGEPLPGTWIFCTGSRRSSALVDSAGFYTLEVPGATLDELERTPLRIRIQARLKGWRFAMPNGAPELGLEMRVTKLETGLARLRVRSNYSEAVQAVASSVVMEANPRALLEILFVGSQGAQYETPPMPLTVSDEITVAGDASSIPELEADAGPPAEPAPVPAAVAKRNAFPPAAARAVERPAEPEPPSEKPSILAEAPVRSEPSSAAASAPPPAATPATPPPARRTTPAGTPPASPQLTRLTTPAGDADRPLVTRLNVRDTLIAHPGLRDAKPGRPIVIRPALGDEAREPKERKPVIANPAGPPPPAASGTSIPSALPAASASGSTTASGAAPPAMPARTPGGRPATPPEARSPLPAADPMLKPVLIRSTTENSVGQRPPAPPQPVVPAPRDSSPASQVGVARTLPPSRPGPQQPLPMCDCVIRGTVEVQSDRALASPTEVVISIEGTSVTTTVELFMGSPRAFEIHPAPCGVHRFVLHTRSKQRFVLVSAEPRVVCTEGGTQQVRLVLEPVARWGASR